MGSLGPDFWLEALWGLFALHAFSTQPFKNLPAQLQTVCAQHGQTRRFCWAEKLLVTILSQQISAIGLTNLKWKQKQPCAMG